MTHISKYACEALGGASMSCIIENGEPWLKAKHAATDLIYIWTLMMRFVNTLQTTININKAILI